jgi:hypothetical protein
MGRCLSFAPLSGGTAGTGQDRQPAQTGDDLAQDFKPFASKIGCLN